MSLLITQPASTAQSISVPECSSSHVPSPLLESQLKHLIVSTAGSVGLSVVPSGFSVEPASTQFLLQSSVGHLQKLTVLPSGDMVSHWYLSSTFSAKQSRTNISDPSPDSLDIRQPKPPHT